MALHSLISKERNMEIYRADSDRAFLELAFQLQKEYNCKIEPLNEGAYILKR
jgi:hypothetical protein